MTTPDMDEAEDHVIRRHGMFFRPGAHGYTMSILGAGRFTKSEATRYLDVEGLTIHHESQYVHEKDEFGAFRLKVSDTAFITEREAENWVCISADGYANILAAARALPAERRAREEAERKAANLEAHVTARANSLLAMRDALINIRDDLEDEGDRVYFGSTNDADAFKATVDDLDGWAWDDIMTEGKREDVFAACRKANARATAAEQRVKALEEALQWYAGEGDEEFFIVDCKGERIASFASMSSRAKAALGGTARKSSTLAFCSTGPI